MRDDVAVFWVSLVGLFLELLLIRWIGTEIRIFAYLQNTVLVVCFLGLGIGLFTSRRSISMRRGFFALVVLAGLTALPATREVLGVISFFLGGLGDINIWYPVLSVDGSSTVGFVALGLLMSFGLMILILEPFIPIGRLLGRLLDRHPRPLVAYSLNVAGSLAGIWLFALLSSMMQPPLTWFLVLVAVALPLLLASRRIDWVATGLLVLVLPLVLWGERSSPARETVWSPYQKLELVRASPERSRDTPASAPWNIRVNNTGYQVMADPADSPKLTTYDVPALVHPDPERVLVVGSGAGTDVVGLLEHGAEHITAVDIDPAIISLGRRYHPARPYDNPAVDVVINDARSFFATTDESYDVIAFGLLDSHTTTSLTNARLDHYVYTRESFERVRDLLEPGGVVTVSFSVIRPFIADRLAVTLRQVFGEEPLVYDFGERTMLFMAGDLPAVRDRIDTVGELSRLDTLTATAPVELGYSTAPATDDWPYLYLDGPQIPPLFLLLAGLLMLLVLYAAKTLELPRTMNPLDWDRSAWHFFFLGAAFLLLEVQNISKASVALGNTWLVNAVIISGILIMILVANAAVIRWPRVPLVPVYACLLATVLGLYFVDLASFAFLPFAWKAVIVGGLTTLPMVFSGIAFARAFAVAPQKDLALGANLLGALVGAVLEAMSFLLGIKALLLAVGLFYAAAMATRPARERLARPGARLAEFPDDAVGRTAGIRRA